MKKSSKPLFYLLLFTGLILFAILLMQPVEVFLFQHDIDILFPKGLIATEQRDLLLILQVLMLFVIVPVYILTFVFSWKYRSTNKRGVYDPDYVDHKLAEIVWWGIPLIMTLVIAVITWIKTHELDPYKSIPSDKKALEIQVVALQWKWLFIYPQEKIATVNTLQIPVGTPVRFLITADAPMNSFWIPALAGQIYAMPGMRTELNLIADEAGEFRGSSANISGEGFSGMHFITKATSQKDFETWVESVKNSGNSLDFDHYKALALPSIDSPPAHFRLDQSDLFDQILMKFMHPHSAKKG